MSIEFTEQITLGDKYGPAMEITEQEKADEYSEACVSHTMRFGKSREEAESIEKINIGYWSGYYGAETRERVERLFRCVHPIFGSIKGPRMIATEVLQKGIEMGREAANVR